MPTNLLKDKKPKNLLEGVEKPRHGSELGPRMTAGVGEFILSSATGLAAEPISGWAGLGDAFVRGRGGQSGGEKVEQVREAMTYQPRTPEGQEVQQAVGEFLAPVGEALQYVSDKAGDVGAAMGRPFGMEAEGDSFGRTALSGIGLAIGGLTGNRLKQTAQQATRQSQKQAAKLAAGSTDNALAKVKLSGGQVVPDAAAKEVIRQGIDEGVVAAIKQGSVRDKLAMRRMVRTLENAKRNKRYGALHRPSDVVGRTVNARAEHVRSVNRVSRRELDIAARSLRGKPVSVDDAVQTFVDDLADMGAKIDPATGKVSYAKDADIPKGMRGVVNQVVERMSVGGKPDAHAAHRLKRYIDELVAYGKDSKSGLAGRTESIIKELRHGVDEALDSSFPAYNQANTRYADTIRVLTELQDIAGKKIDLTGASGDAALGRLSRRIFGNAQSRERLMEALGSLDEVSKRYGGNFDDDMITQAMFVQELERKFGTTATSSLQGDVDKVLERRLGQAADGQRGVVAYGLEKVGEAANKARGINEDAALKALKRLLTPEKTQ